MTSSAGCAASWGCADKAVPPESYGVMSAMGRPVSVRAAALLVREAGKSGDPRAGEGAEANGFPSGLLYP
ncbi:hypothetical protein GCM10017771_56300 [Streptomyces capitiformicae]|uniref:Uncharacterized protein n=1 Tax=Streptomyces capitiformicae TaxID=2014920 RepID=A0A918Z6E2_9ACTN|nr:hypothetical protein GCM10017771_56300 [Streptomyces capitiformicae]